ncbi:MAG: M15 family metallopeptidase [Bauldia sp.]
MKPGFAFADTVLAGIRWDAKYATADNFTGAPVDGYGVDRVVVSAAVAKALAEAGRHAEALGFGLLLWDGYRPQRAVNRFKAWAALPEDRRLKERYHPNIARAEMFALGYLAEKSSHSRGSAVDLTLFRRDTGAVVPMGGDFDLMDVRSQHGAPGIGLAETANRKTLCTIMERSGFAPFEREWWHYALIREPHPDTYFDFPIL